MSPTFLTFFGFLRDAIDDDNPNYELQMTDATFLYHRSELGMHTNDREHALPDFKVCVEKLD